ncbi:hypothetical protein [uncultured Kordia sp.]|uniref:hypothetical protein n=1 Tax=uncultured Kordia sp. TaxID=507699 RepID=UPI00260B43BF|nr:hypothetical protein [uncultured Kordia sp.]
MKQTLETLKSYFETGDKPTQAQYEDLLDSLIHVNQVPVQVHTATASSKYASAAYDPIHPFRNIVQQKAGFSNYHWLSESGQTTNQRLCIYFLNPCSISRFTYINAGQNTIAKGGIKTCRMYGMTAKMMYDTTHGAIAPEMTDVLFSGDLEQYTESQFDEGGVSVEISKTPVIYGIVLDMDNKHNGEAYIGLKAMNFYQ